MSITQMGKIIKPRVFEERFCARTSPGRQTAHGSDVWAVMYSEPKSRALHVTVLCAMFGYMLARAINT
jgi:hypothetical protein